MASPRKDLVFRFLGDTKSLERSVASADTAFSKLDSRASMSGKAIESMGKKLVAAFAVGKVVEGVKAVVNSASDLNESMNAVEVATGSAAGQIQAFGRTAAENLGMSRTAVNEAAVAFAAFGEKIDAGNVAGVFQEYATRATDFASVMNLDVNDAMAKFQSGLAGESEPLRKFGIDMSAASVSAYAYANGIAEAGSALSETEKVQARYGLLLEQTDKFAGDFANTSDELANSQRRASAEFENAKAALGQSLLPVIADATALMVPLINNFAKGTYAIRDFFGAVSEEERDAHLLGEALNFVAQQMDSGMDAANAAFQAMGQLAAMGELTADSMGAVAEATGLTRAEMKRVAAGVADSASAFGILDTEVAGVSRLFATYIESMRKDGISAQQEYTGALLDTQIALRSKADAAGDAMDSITGLTESIREFTDPVFNAIDAAAHFQEVLAAIDEDGHRTNEELIELAKASGALQEALDAVTPDNMTATNKAMQAELGLTGEEVDKIIRSTGALDGKHFRFTVTGEYVKVNVGGYTDPNKVENRFEGVDGLPQFHSGGVVGGKTGTNEVLKVLEKGEGVIDADTMREGLSTGGQTVNVYIGEREFTDFVLDNSTLGANLRAGRRRQRTGR